jgi:hypothetical protein
MPARRAAPGGQRQAEAAVQVFLALVGGAIVLGTVVILVRVSIKALGTPADRAAGNQMLQQTAALLGGLYVDRREIVWHRRPAQYGVVEGELNGMAYQLYLMPWNAEDCGGAAMLNIAPWTGQPVSHSTGMRVFTPSETFHWPDRADSGALADYVRQAIATAIGGGRPPSLP